MAWRSRGYFPHLEGPGLIQHVVFHLADSLPREVVERLDREWKQADELRRNELRRENIDAWLDSGHGRSVLREPELAKTVQDSLLCFHTQRYLLSTWVVMPNHVHVLLQTVGEWTLGQIVGSWKSYTGRRINAWLNAETKGSLRSEGEDAALEHGVPREQNAALERGVPVWHREYFDRYMRDEEQLAATILYIHENPVTAGLVAKAEEWPWSSAFPANTERLKPRS